MTSAEALTPEPNVFDVCLAAEKIKICKSPGIYLFIYRNRRF
jgi:hypothetical protein